MPLDDELDEILDPILATLNETLKAKLIGQLAEVYISGSVQMMKYAGLPYEGPPMQEAISWAQKHCGELVTQMAETSQKEIAQIVAEGIKQKKGVYGLRQLGGIQKDLMDAFKGMSKERAYMIARTETGNALGAAFEARGKELGLEAKQWYCAGGDACPDCLANEAVGVIPFEDTFPSGHSTVVAHPQCRCAVAPARFK